MNERLRIQILTRKRKILVLVLIVLIIFHYISFSWRERNDEMQNAIIMEFPLRGEWYSPNTPGTKIPSHGTDKFGTTYAYDFIQVDWDRKGWPAYRVNLLQYLLFGVPINEYYCWGQEIYAPCDGIVVIAEDGYAEQERTNIISDISNAYKNAHYFDLDKDSVQSIAGNYVIIKYDDNVYAALCHLQTGSIQVTVGQSVKKGDMIGMIGHSGNSFAPHLHFQLMDSCDISNANGLPCAFEKYELFQNGEWRTVENGIPTNSDRIRFIRSE